ncbi:MAG: hypothetical protein HZC16_00080 [Candidatus Omnitrophica bacterium]|nr:hypothetical protein [Candidatus Omnitrophota bacterium]
MIRLTIVILLVLFITASGFALEATSSAYKLDLINFSDGGAAVSSATNIDLFTCIGETFGAVQESLSTNHSLLIGEVAILFAQPHFKGIRVISDLRASTEALGTAIPEAVWQKDNDPYFYWSIDIEPASLLAGFAVSLDVEPTEEITTTEPHYQFAEGSIASGKHIFYVLPFTSDKGWDESSLLKFEIWVDATAPYANSLQPPAGTITSSSVIPISCALYDEHSGIDTTNTTVTINESPVSFTYDAQKITVNPGTGLSEGKNTILLKAYDWAGNYIVKGWDFVLDTQYPVGSIMLNAGEKVAYSAYVFINIKVEDVVSGIKNIYISNDGVFDTEMQYPYPYAPVIYHWLVAEPDTDGVKIVYVRFADAAGNISDTYKAQIELRRLTPDTWVISGPESITEKAEGDFVYDATKVGCQFSYKLDNGEWSDWSGVTAAHFSGLQEGNHYFYVKAAYDLNQDGSITVDEEDSTPAQRVWTIKPVGYLEKLRQRILFWKR